MTLPTTNRRCNRCNKDYLPTDGRCPTCGCPEFRLPTGTVQAIEDAKKKERKKAP